MNHLTTIGWFHLAFAAFGLVTGAIQLLRRKGDRLHRALGYAYVYGMIVANATALTMYRFTGSFNVFHAGAVVNFVCIIAAMIPVLRTPRAPDWRMKHYRWMSGSYIGLVAAAATEFSVRVLPLGSRGAVWIAAGVVTLAVSVIGSVLIRRNRRIAMPGTEAATSR
jgi:uncharacterized membrane protein